MSETAAVRILVLAANPKNSDRLRLDQEVREIEEGLRRSRYRDRFVLKAIWAPRHRDLRRALLDHEPAIVHFSGLNSRTDGLALEGKDGSTHAVSGAALADLFLLFKNKMDCVVLNACYSEVQAKEIAKHIGVVVGMSKAVADETALEFAVAFYDALASGKSYTFAYKLACASIGVANLPGHLIPRLLLKNNVELPSPPPSPFFCEYTSASPTPNDRYSHGEKPHYALLVEAQAERVAEQDLPPKDRDLSSYNNARANFSSPRTNTPSTATRPGIRRSLSDSESSTHPSDHDFRTDSAVAMAASGPSDAESTSITNNGRSTWIQVSLCSGLIVFSIFLYYLSTDKWEAPPLKAAVVCFLPLLIYLLIDAVSKLRYQRARMRLIHLGVHGRLKRPGYFRLSPYTEGEEYFRADGAHEEVLLWIQESSKPILYLTGRSGTGKSSLLQAWVKPRLTDCSPPFRVIEARTFNEPTQALKKALKTPGEIWQRGLQEELAPRDLLEKACRHLRGRRLLILLDQFEEYLILSNRNSRNEFEQLLHSLEENPIPELKLLLVLRSDYISQVSRMRLPPLTQLGNWKSIGPFTEPDSRDFLTGSGLEIGQGALDQAIREAEQIEEVRGLIRPITLNMIGVVLSRSLGQIDAGRIVRGYVNDVLRQIGMKSEALKILQAMLSDEGTKYPRNRQELASKTGVGSDLIQGCLVQLGNEGLVRQIDRGAQVWEISHDFLARVLDQMLVRLRSSWWHFGKKILAYSIWPLWLLTLLLYIVEFRDNYAVEQLRHLYVDVEGGRAIFSPQHFRPEDFEAASKYLSMARGIKAISLSSVPITSIEPLGSLSQLQELDLSHTKVGSLIALKRLRALRKVVLHSTAATSLEGIQGATGLRELYIDESSIADLKPLSSLSSLKFLYLTNSKLDGFIDLKPLSKLRRLRELQLSGTSVKAIDAISDLRLDKLSLDRSKILSGDFDSLSNISSLTHLNLAETAVRSLDFVYSLGNLEWLRLNKTVIDDLSPLRNSVSLHYLYLNETNVENLAPLRGLPLMKLELRECKGGTLINTDALYGMKLEADLSGSNIMPAMVEQLEKRIDKVIYRYTKSERVPRIESGWQIATYATEESDRFSLDALACDDARNVLWVKGYKSGSGEGVRLGTVTKGKIDWKAEINDVKVSGSGTGITVVPDSGHLLFPDERKSRVVAVVPSHREERDPRLRTYLRLPHLLNPIRNGTGQLQFTWNKRDLFFWDSASASVWKSDKYTSEVYRLAAFDQAVDFGFHRDTYSNDLIFDSYSGTILLSDATDKAVLEIDPATGDVFEERYLSGFTGRPHSLALLGKELFVLVETRSLFVGSRGGKEPELVALFPSARDITVCRLRTDGPQQLFVVDLIMRAIFEVKKGHGA